MIDNLSTWINDLIIMVNNLRIEKFQFPVTLEIIATLAWAVSGAIVARARSFDFTGVFIIALLSCIGGGLIRDGIFLQTIPAMLKQAQYLLLALVAAGLISLFGGYWQRLDWWDVLVHMIDAVGTPAFTLIGFQLAYFAGINFLGALFVGLVNGVAGGILRDVLVGDVPRFFRPGQLSALILVLTLFLYVGMLVLQMNSDTAAWVAIFLAAIARWLVIRFNLHTRPVTSGKSNRPSPSCRPISAVEAGCRGAGMKSLTVTGFRNSSGGSHERQNRRCGSPAFHAGCADSPGLHDRAAFVVDHPVWDRCGRRPASGVAADECGRRRGGGA
jgi:uncharacterized membrane protein YeiH